MGRRHGDPTTYVEGVMMAMNWVQFQRGLSMSAFQNRYGTERACEEAVLNARWPNGFVCSRCEGTTCCRFERGGRSFWQCSGCRHQCSLLAGTIFDNTKLPLTLWFQALYVLTQTKNNVSALELMRHLGVCYRTAWRLKHKVMSHGDLRWSPAMTEREAGGTPAGRHRAGRRCVSGRERNGGKAGRGSENKVPFVIAVEISAEGHPRQAVITPVPGFTLVALTDWTQRHLRPDTDVYDQRKSLWDSDGLGAFRAVIEVGHAHTVIESAGGRATTEAGGMRWLNTVLSNVKCPLDGTYHAFKFPTYAHRYLVEAAWRFNRRFDLKILVPRLLVAVARCKPWPERHLRAVTARPRLNFGANQVRVLRLAISSQFRHSSLSLHRLHTRALQLALARETSVAGDAGSPAK